MTERTDSEVIIEEYPELTALPDVVLRLECSFVTQHNAQGEALAALFNEFLAQFKDSGAYEQMGEKWMSEDGPAPKVEPCLSDGSRGVLRISTSNDWPPYCYVSEGENAGLFFNIMCRFCEWSGYTPEFDVVSFGSAFAGVVSGKYDILAYGYVYSEERAEEVTFTDVLEGDDVLMMVRRDSVAESGYTDISQLAGKTFAESAGSMSEEIITENIHDAKFLYVGGYAEILMAVESGKADACITGGGDIEEMQLAYPGLRALPTDFEYPPGAYVTAKSEKGRALAAEFNEYFAMISESGEYDAMQSRWQNAQEGDAVMPDYVFIGEKGELNVGVNVSVFPYTYVTEYGYSGEEIELINGFCAWAGYTPDMEDADFPALCAGLSTGKYDFLAVTASITEERIEQMTFTDPIARAEPIVVLVRDESAAETEKGFFEKLGASFEKNFIRESRWKLMLSGLGVTVALALCAAVLGTLLGALICFMRLSRNPFATGFARMYVKLFQGMPIVVLLLLLYYVIFGKTDISTFIVCAMGFSLDFSAYTAEIFRSGIEAVPAGQQRAALALGFGRVKAFLDVVLPQALRHILPVYRGQFIAMVKTTAVAGYISVQDLTKVSDIIRSRTYEAFFPLISTTVIYFLLAALLVSVLRIVEKRTDPYLRVRKPKGVEL